MIHTCIHMDIHAYYINIYYIGMHLDALYGISSVYKVLTSSHRHGDKAYKLVKCMALWGEQRVDSAMLCNVSWRQSMCIRV